VVETKKQSEQHITDALGEQLLRARLPPQWVLRPYRPDYGLDFTLETFAAAKDPSAKVPTYETLGEHLFIQLKSAKTIDSSPLQLFQRRNVEKERETLDKNELAGVLQTIRYQIDTSELATVERMGVGVPVLLVVANLASSQCHFVCLSDYIDKILIPRYDAYSDGASRTIHVPIANEVSDQSVGLPGLRWYAKRPKLCGAFHRFVFQHAELEYAWETKDFLPMARYFASKIVSYDFWDDTEMWVPIKKCGDAVRRFHLTGDPKLSMSWASKAEGDATSGGEDALQTHLWQVRELWRRLSVLPRNYEDINREWFLPTALGYYASYAKGVS